MPDTMMRDRDIQSLKRLLRLAWKNLASPSLTSPQRREILDQVKTCNTELRRCIDAAEADRRRQRNGRDLPGTLDCKPEFRFIAFSR